ncbi:MAG: RNA methyltransferase, partial [Rikenellaceae bacterium]|nr:RNA methyltransferase [Rikenellaceae bacterium]
MCKKLNSELGRITPQQYSLLEKIPVVVVADNVRSLHNVGALFRTCDAFGMQAVYLCGITAQPPHKEIHKTALGAENSVPWRYFQQTSQAVAALKTEGYTLLAVEQTEGAVPLDRWNREAGTKYALVFGNEVNGVVQEVVDLCDGAIEIPQIGTKHSLNVSVCAGVVL